MQTTKARSGCGCGGGGGGCGGSCGGGCGCKPAKLPEAAPAACSPCETASFIRPRFFAGQLLTEDDLGALIDYVVAKHRFHNSRLFGAGVVCGLEVECGPCDSTQIVVKPGYALDCCGNDLVLTCERVLDLAPMIRELASKRDGGCTDPCPPPKPPATGTNEQPEVLPFKQYCLYARYAERPDQPVAAYPVGDDCDATTCEPTRIVEGIVFELRCPPPPTTHTIEDVAEACSRWLERDAALTSRAVRLTRIGAALERAPSERDGFAAADLEILRDLVKDPEPLGELEGADRVRGLTYLLSDALPLSLHHSVLGVPFPKGYEAEKLQASVRKWVDELREVDPESTLQPDDSRMAKALVAHYDAAHERVSDAEKRALVQRGPYAAPDVLSSLFSDLHEVAAKLTQIAGCGKHTIHTDCALRELLDKLAPAWNAYRPELAEYRRLGGQLKGAADAIRKFVIDCRCAAINPPCPPCDDPGVLLACFQVDRCKVVTICNTVRQYVLAPTTLRYWDAIEMPGWISNCCGGDRKPLPQPGGRVPEVFTPTVTKNFGRLTSMEMPALALRERIAEYVAAEPRVHPTDELAELKKTVAALQATVKTLTKKKESSS